MITLRELGEGLKVKRKSSSNRVMVPFTDGFVCSGSKSQKGKTKTGNKKKKRTVAKKNNVR